MMQNTGFLALGTVAIVLLFFGMRSFDDDGRFNPLRTAPEMAVEVEAGAPRSITLYAGRGGHFEIDADLGGHRALMLVDTGATITTLRQSDARRAGIGVRDQDFRVPLNTANGTIYGAPARLPTLGIGPVTLRDLDVMVLPDDKLGENLFGTNALSRFARWESNPKTMVLYTD